MLKKYCLPVLVLILLLGSPALSMAQCPMCKASVESSIKSGKSNAGKGLNNGILYLLAAPYLVVASVGFFWYKKFRRKPGHIDIQEDKINLN
jgi:hypothetical protein